jgi:polar amino acid transport system substrate-binding protein
MSQRILRVGVSSFPPFVFKKGGVFTGFEVALWEAVADQLGVESRYEHHTLSGLLRKVKNRQVDIGFAGISKTEGRERDLDFTHATYKSGLHILVRTKGRLRFFASLRDVWKQRGRNIVQAVAGLGAFVAMLSHAVWFVERGQGSFAADYAQGIGDAVWYTVVTVSTVGYGDFTPVTLAGRVLGVIAIIVGYAFFALFIAELNSALVLEKLRSSIRGPEDLRGRRVATVRGTAAETWLNKYDAAVLPKPTFQDAVVLLLQEEADAVVFDAPVVQHYVKEHGSDAFHVVGPRFEEHDYGFVIPEHSPLREQVNRAILHLVETGKYERLYRQWFAS